MTESTVEAPRLLWLIDRFLKAGVMLRKRLARFLLEQAEEKTKLIRFGRFAARDHQRAGEGAAQTFDFLGFTHSRKSGRR